MKCPKCNEEIADVAKLAGAPKKMLTRANEILKTLEKKVKIKEKQEEKEMKKQVTGQLDMYNYKLADIASELDKIDVNELTPIDALNTIVKIKEKMKKSHPPHTQPRTTPHPATPKISQNSRIP